MSDKQKKILITGSSGFIGSNVKHHFKEKYLIIAPTHKELDLLCQEDVLKFLMEYEYIDYVIHCANVGGNRKGDNENIIFKNLQMFFNIYQNKQYFGRMIHFGTGAEYNKKFELKNVKETYLGKNIPTDDYGFSKYVLTRFIENADKVYCLKLFGVFGPNEDYEFRFISNAIVKNLLHLPFKIMQNTVFDWLYIEDLLDILHFFLDNEPKYKTYNVTSGKTIDLVSVAKMINALSDFQSEIIIENEGLNLEYSGDNSRLIAEIGEYDFTTMEAAIQKLIKHYKGCLDEINLQSIMCDKYASYCKINKR